MTSLDRSVTAFNRILVILVALGVLGGAIGLLVDPAATVGVVGKPAAILGAIPAPGLSLDAGIALVVALGILLVEVLPARSPGMFEARVDGGIVGYTSDAVARALAAEVSAREGIAEPRVQVSARRGRANVRVILFDSWGTDTPSVATRVAARIRERAKAMGLTVGDVRVDVQSPARDDVNESQRAQPVA